jgi:hypothetical protein
LFTDDEVDQYTNGAFVVDTMMLQTKSILDGNIDLGKMTDDKITSLENPYDITSRTRFDVNYLFDSAYYNGKFYQYFSILPVIFFMLPIRLITGYYVLSKVVNTFLFVILCILISITYKKVVDKFINKISLFNFILGYVTIILGSDVMNFTRGMMYDVPVTFGMISLFTVILIIFNLKETKKLTGIKLVFAGIFTGFVVMSKPSLIGYYILIFYLLYDYLKLYKDNKKVVIKRFLLFFIPLSILGIIQMYFNYIRFDSIFDFGALRQLTVADMNVQTGFSIIAIIKGFSRFLFTLPHIEIFKFPFINTYDNNYYYMGFNEYEYENSVSGIFFIPIIWGLFLKNKLKKGEKEEKKLWHVANLVIITVCVLVTIISCFAGAAESYFIDIKLMLVIMSVVVLLKIIEKYKVSDKIELEKYNQIFFILCIVSIFLVLPQSFSTEASSLENMYMPINIVLSNFFMFWL